MAAKLTTGRVDSALYALELVLENQYSADFIRSAFDRLLVVPATEAVDFAVGVNWLVPGAEQSVVTKAGHEALQARSEHRGLRHAIHDFAIHQRPGWLQLFPRGRLETLSGLSPQTRQCFEEAGLTRGADAQTVAWWDRLAEVARSHVESTRLDIGRRGERASLAYEELRVGRRPRWQSIESNLSGYDVLSVWDASDQRPLAIEVKASTVPFAKADFYLTRHEWEVAVEFTNYRFHLWHFSDKQSRLAQITPEEVVRHVPEDGLAGSWTVVRIPFSTFASDFIVVTS